MDAHLQDCVCHVVDVPRVDQQRARAQALRCACKLTQHQHSMVLCLAGDVFVAHQVHAVAQAGHQRDVCDRVERAELSERETAVQMVDGHVHQRAVLACK